MGAEAKAKRKAETKAKKEAEIKAKQEADSKAKQDAEAKAKQEAETKTKQEAEAKAKKEAETKAKHEAETKAEQEVDAKAKQKGEKLEEEENEAGKKKKKKKKKGKVSFHDYGTFDVQKNADATLQAAKKDLADLKAKWEDAKNKHSRGDIDEVELSAAREKLKASVTILEDGYGKEMKG